MLEQAIKRQPTVKELIECNEIPLRKSLIISPPRRTKSVATAPKHVPPRKLSKSTSTGKLARDLNGLVEKKFGQMSPAERIKKHEEFISALKGQRP